MRYLLVIPLCWVLARVFFDARTDRKARILRWLSLCLLLTVGCSGSHSPMAPTPPPVVPTTPTTITLTGRVMATNGGQPLANVLAAAGNVTATTDTAGGFSVQTLPSGSLSLALTGSGIVPRSLYVAAGSSRSVTVDAIALAGFDLNFYRQLVRNGFEQPTSLQPLRRWTRNPNVFIQTGADAATLDMVEAVIRDSVPRWTAGQFNVATVERGAGSREGQAGWLTVTWNPANTGHCGSADVGRDGGVIDIQSGTPNCACNGWQSRPTTIRHELGHAMGFWHTGAADDLMVGANGLCDKPISARELSAAAIAYSRPVGNSDPDADPSSAVNLAPMRVR